MQTIKHIYCTREYSFNLYNISNVYAKIVKLWLNNLTLILSLFNKMLSIITLAFFYSIVLYVIFISAKKATIVIKKVQKSLQCVQGFSILIIGIICSSTVKEYR